MSETQKRERGKEGTKRGGEGGWDVRCRRRRLSHSLNWRGWSEREGRKREREGEKGREKGRQVWRRWRLKVETGGVVVYKINDLQRKGHCHTLGTQSPKAGSAGKRTFFFFPFLSIKQNSLQSFAKGPMKINRHISQDPRFNVPYSSTTNRHSVPMCSHILFVASLLLHISSPLRLFASPMHRQGISHIDLTFMRYLCMPLPAAQTDVCTRAVV